MSSTFDQWKKDRNAFLELTKDPFAVLFYELGEGTLIEAVGVMFSGALRLDWVEHPEYEGVYVPLDPYLRQELDKLTREITK